MKFPRAIRRRRGMVGGMHAGKLLLILLTAVGGSGLSVRAQQEDGGEPPPAPDPVARIRQVIEDLAGTPAVSSGTVGFYLAPLETADQPLAARAARQSFITASTMKTLTTGTALEVLGPDFRFETRVLFSPSTGDLILQGAGDPSLGRPDWEDLFNDWTNRLAAAGVREIRGRVIADETAWESQEIPDGWAWLDMGNYYAPPLTPLCYQDNSLRVHFKLSGKPGQPAGFYDADPWPSGLNFADELRIGQPGTGDNAYLYGAPGATVYTVRGTLAPDTGRDYIRGALPDPALFCAQHFTDWLNQHEIPVHGAATTTRRLETSARIALTFPEPPAPKPVAKPAPPVKAAPKGRAKTKTPAPAPTPAAASTPAPSTRAFAGWTLPKDARPVGSRFSAPLGDMLIPINHLSLNLDCECLLKTLGKGSTRAGLARIRKHLSGKKLPMAGYEQQDGSGLSRTNMITPELLARANAAFLTGPHAADYLASLPEVGQSGSTLHSLEVSHPATVIRAKSGTVERVKSYTGVVDTGDGRRFIFAVLINNYDGSYGSDVAPGLHELFEALGEL